MQMICQSKQRAAMTERLKDASVMLYVPLFEQIVKKIV